MRWISSSSRTPAASASCAVPAPWTSTFVSPAARLPVDCDASRKLVHQAFPRERLQRRFIGSRRAPDPQPIRVTGGPSRG
jgi:hypothetical protein